MRGLRKGHDCPFAALVTKRRSQRRAHSSICRRAFKGDAREAGEKRMIVTAPIRRTRVNDSAERDNTLPDRGVPSIAEKSPRILAPSGKKTQGAANRARYRETERRRGWSAKVRVKLECPRDVKSTIESRGCNQRERESVASERIRYLGRARPAARWRAWRGGEKSPGADDNAGYCGFSSWRRRSAERAQLRKNSGAESSSRRGSVKKSD